MLPHLARFVLAAGFVLLTGAAAFGQAPTSQPYPGDQEGLAAIWTNDIPAYAGGSNIAYIPFKPSWGVTTPKDSADPDHHTRRLQVTGSENKSTASIPVPEGGEILQPTVGTWTVWGDMPGLPWITADQPSHHMGLRGTVYSYDLQYPVGESMVTERVTKVELTIKGHTSVQEDMNFAIAVIKVPWLEIQQSYGYNPSPLAPEYNSLSVVATFEWYGGNDVLPPWPTEPATQPTTEPSGGDIITDFAKGVNGDVLDLRDILADAGYVGDDPFADGILSFVPSGANTQIQVDADAVGPNPAATVVTLLNVSLTQTDTANFLVASP